MLSRSSGGTAAADRQLSANLGSVGSARGSPEEAPGLMASDMDRLQLAQARLHCRYRRGVKCAKSTADNGKSCVCSKNIYLRTFGAGSDGRVDTA